MNLGATHHFARVMRQILNLFLFFKTCKLVKPQKYSIFGFQMCLIHITSEVLLSLGRVLLLSIHFLDGEKKILFLTCGNFIAFSAVILGH